MNKLIAGIMIATFALFGVLHAGYFQHKTLEDSSIAQQYVNQYPEEMPDIVLQPLTNIPLNW